MVNDDTTRYDATIRADGGGVVGDHIQVGSSIILNGKSYKIESRVKTSEEATVYIVNDGNNQFVLKHHQPLRPLSDNAKEIINKIIKTPHKRIIGMIESGTYNNQDYELMEYALGGTLSEYLSKKGITDITQLKKIIKMINEGLQLLHNTYNVIYQDLKPGNIFFRDVNQTELVLADFDISTVMEPNEKKATVVADLTDLYGALELSPKTGHKFVIATPAVDYYSLGITILEMWLGEKPFQNLSPVDRDYLISEEQVVLPPNMPADLKTLILGLIKRKRTDRFGYKEVMLWINGEQLQSTTKTSLNFNTEMFNDTESFSNPKELANLMVKYPDQGVLMLYSGIAESWFEKSGRSLRALELKEVINSYKTDKQAGCYSAVYKIDPSRPFISNGGKVCDNLEDIVSAMISESSYYKADLKNQNARLYLYLIAVEGSKGVTVSDSIRKFFKDYTPNRAFDLTCSLLQGRCIIYPDGTIYEGDIVDGTCHGKGIKIYPNSESYEGEFFQGEYHGHGLYKCAYGDVYEGGFHDGFFHGFGKKILANGNVYEGEFVDGTYEGKGKLTIASNGRVYTGDFFNGKANGKGKLVRPDGGYYEGDYLDDVPHGYGKFVDEKGDTYEGEWVKNKLHGMGKYIYANGDVYEGNYSDGKRNGMGKFTGVDGREYDGFFLDDKANGEGTLTKVGEFVYEGSFIDDRFSGEGKITYTDGSIYKGNFVNGFKSGKGKLTNQKGKETIGYWEEDEYVGKTPKPVPTNTTYSQTYSNKDDDDDYVVRGSGCLATIFGLIGGVGAATTIIWVYLNIFTDNPFPIKTYLLLLISGFALTYFTWRYKLIKLFLMILALSIPCYLVLFGVLPERLFDSKLVETVFSEKQPTATITGNVRFRSEPSTDARIIRQLSQGDTVILTGKEIKDWTQVRHNGDTGWVRNEYLRK